MSAPPHPPRLAADLACALGREPADLNGRAGGMSDALTISLPPELVEQIARRAAALLAEQTTGPSPWLDVDGAARHLGYADNLARGRRRVYDLVSRRELEPRRDGKRLLFRPSDIDRYLEENT